MSLTGLEYLKNVDVTLYNLFNSHLYDGAWFAKKTAPYDFSLNNAFKGLLGYPLEQELEWKSIIFAGDRENFQNSISHFSSQEKNDSQNTVRFTHKNRSIVWLTYDIYSSTEAKSEYLFIGFKESPRHTEQLESRIDSQVEDLPVLDNNGIGTWQYNYITGENIFSQSNATMIGYTLEELQNMGEYFWLDLIHPDDIDNVQRTIKEHIASKSSSFSYKFRMKHKQGHWIWVLDIGSIMSYTADGQPEWMGGIHYGVTSKNKDRLLVQHYRELLDEINEAAEIGVWEIDMETNQITCSDEIKRIFGIPLSYQLTLDKVFGFVKKGHSQQKLKEAMKKATTEGINYDLEIEIVTANKKSLWTRAIGISQFEDGVCTHFYGFFQNINDIILATKKLALKEELFKKTFSHAAVGMAVIDLKGNISRVNKSLCQYLGYSEAELLKSNLNSFSHPSDQAVVKEHINALIAGTSESFKIDTRYINKNNSILWGHISVSSVRSEKDRIIYFIVQVEDVTERKSNELMLINYKDLLERSNDVAKIGSWELDLSTNRIQWSASLRNILATQDHLITSFINDFVADEHKKFVHSAIRNAIEIGLNFDLEILVKMEGSELKWMRMVGIAEFENGHSNRVYGLLQDIDAIKIAQIEVINKEEQWRTTFNHANAGIALLGFDGTASTVNQSVCDIFGYNREEMLNMRIKDISLPEDLCLYIEIMSDLITGKKKNFVREMRFLHKDGHVIWLNVSVSSVKNDDHKFTHMVAQLVDITASKTNEILLNQYKEILERSNKVAKIGSWALDPKTHTVFWSDNVLRLMGTPDYKPHAVETSITDYVLEENQLQLKGLFQEALTRGSNFDLELQLKTATGPRWFRLIAISEWEDGSCTSVHGLVQDIEDFKRAQLEVQLREEEFRQTFYHAPIGMSFLDLSGKIFKMNPRMCETFGMSEDELMNVDYDVICHPDDVAATNQYMKEILTGRRESFEQEKRYYDKNRNLIWTILSISAVKNDKEETTHFVCQVTDITDKKLLAESLQEHNNRLQNYAHIVSHNLRSHTGNLSMLLELSEINPNKGCDAELFQHIKTATNEMCDTVNHLTEIVEIQHLIKNTFVPINLRKRIKSAVNNIQSAVKQLNGEIKIKVNKELMIYGISSYVDSVIMNILTNAIKYRSSERLLKIDIEAENSGEYTVVAISDNGIGIDLERHSEKMFGMYKTFHEHKNARGIGLFMSKNQMEAMDGHIEVESQLNKGTTFRLYFKNEND